MNKIQNLFNSCTTCMDTSPGIIEKSAILSSIGTFCFGRRKSALSNCPLCSIVTGICPNILWILLPPGILWVR